MDLIFYLGNTDQKLPRFLERLGYAVLGATNNVALPDLISRTNVDLILIDGRVMGDMADMCSFLRSQENTRAIPIVCISPENSSELYESDVVDKIEIVQAPFSVGMLAGRIATQLRLRKQAGNDELQGSLAEINAALRDHNERFRKELEEARAIQQSLLPLTLPSDERFQVAVSYQPLEEVGGDWYFAQVVSDGQIALQVADVSGHGLSAAFIGSMTKLAMTASEHSRPDQLLSDINRHLAPQIPEGRFVTMGGALYNPATGRVQWARAGHQPALVLARANNNKNGAVRQLRGEGFAVGFVENSSYLLVEDTLAPGDALLMFTDGISEAQNRSRETFGIERLSAALIKTSAQASAPEMLRAILDDFNAFRQDRLLKDDLTLMLLKRTA
ncbi:MAG: SpoIIE family protein phosphatase [Proteobacteria bacterium]|nr:SpoIIE family protein phosphatase [Pseudomonadota bacterium]